MDLLNTFASLFSNFGNLTWQMVVMWGIGALLIYLAIAKKMEPSLLLPMGFGAILVNLPLSGAITQGDTVGPISALFEAGMSNELFPLLLFIGIGAMIDFGPLLAPPPFSWPTRSTPSTSVPLWWQPTATWRWCPSCSRP